MNADEAGVCETVLPRQRASFLKPVILLRDGDLVGRDGEFQHRAVPIRHICQQSTHVFQLVGWPSKVRAVVSTTSRTNLRRESWSAWSPGGEDEDGCTNLYRSFTLRGCRVISTTCMMPRSCRLVSNAKFNGRCMSMGISNPSPPLPSCFGLNTLVPAASAGSMLSGVARSQAVSADRRTSSPCRKIPASRLQN